MDQRQELLSSANVPAVSTNYSSFQRDISIRGKRSFLLHNRSQIALLQRDSLDKPSYRAVPPESVPARFSAV